MNHLPAMAGKRPVFITARFRSGSTLLWHMYEQAAGYQAYYEPCHDNLLAHIHYTEPMASHRGVENYWGAYRGLLAGLKARHRPEFGLTRLVLEADESWEELKSYLDFLIAAAGPDVPVLQFNRADFRLPWLRRQFPEARIVHLYRDSRESYFSMTRHLAPEEADDPWRGHLYDLLEWSLALAEDFPFLADPGIGTLYERHYYLWKLSYLMGSRLSDLSLSYDDHFRTDRRAGLGMLAGAGLLPPGQVEALAGLIRPGEAGQWAGRHPASWFEPIEARCEQVLEELGLSAHFGRLPLAEIRRRHARAWERFQGLSLAPLGQALLLEYSRQRAEVTRLLFLVRRLEKEG